MTALGNLSMRPRPNHAVFAAVLSLVLVALPANAQVTSDEPYRFMLALLQSLSKARSATAAVLPSDSTGSVDSRLGHSIFAATLANHDLDAAIQTLAPFQSSDEELIAKITEAAIGAYRASFAWNKFTIVDSQRLLELDQLQNYSLAEASKQQGSLAAAELDAWGNLLDAAGEMVMDLQFGRRHLRLTSSQRGDVHRACVNNFGPGVRTKTRPKRDGLVSYVNFIANQTYAATALAPTAIRTP